MRTSRLTRRARPCVRRPLLLEQLEGRVNPGVVATPAFDAGSFPQGPAEVPLCPPEQSQAVHATFDLGTLAAADFPSDRFTVADKTQNTGRRVNLPLPPDPTSSAYQDTQVLNTLDGFNLQPRLSIPFDGPIDVTTVDSSTVFLVSLGDRLDPHDHGGQVVGINQVVWDQLTNTLNVWPDELLDQHTRYALVVTDGIHDAAGRPVEATQAFRLAPLTLALSPDPVLRNYGREMVEGLAGACRAGEPLDDVVTVSVFTTESATAILEKIRDQIHAGTPAPADFNLGPNGERTVFNLDQVTAITFNQQTTVKGPLVPAPLDLSLLRINIPGAEHQVGQVAYGSYLSPDYEVHPGEYIPAVGTRTGTPAVQGYNKIYFDLFLPSGERPPDGWPVAIFGPGAQVAKDSSFGVPGAAAMLAANGIATIGINVVGQGFGPLGTLTVKQSAGGPVTLPAGGRGIDQNGDGIIGSTEGLAAAAPQAIISQRDGRIQTTADLLQLVQVIEAGVDVDGDGTAALDPSRMYYVGASLGGMYGAAFLAVEPDVGAGVLTAVGGPDVEINRLRPSRGTLGTILASRVSLPDNGPGITSLDGLAALAPYFNENMPLRDGVPLTVKLADKTTRVIQSPVTNTVPVAMAIQQVFDNWEWVSQPGNPVAYAPHLRKDPLPGVPDKSVIVQFAEGDQNVENPTTTAFLRAGDLADRATFYRYDLAFPAIGQQVPMYPHTFLGQITSPNPTIKAVALGAQRQVATFFATDGQVIDDLADITTSDGTPLFEVPIQGPLPEGLNFVGVLPGAAPSLAVGGTVGPDDKAAGGDPVSYSTAWDAPGLSRPAGPGPVGVRVTDLPGDLLGLTFGSMAAPGVDAPGRGWFQATPSGDQADQVRRNQFTGLMPDPGPFPGHGRESVVDRALTAAKRPIVSPGSDPLDVAALDRVFADSELGP